MDSLERTRMAGAMVDHLERLGCSKADIVAVAAFMAKHVEVKELYDQELGGFSTMSGFEVGIMSTIAH